MKKTVVYGLLAILLFLMGLSIITWVDPLRKSGGDNGITRAERKRIGLYVTAMKGAFARENGGNAFIAVDLRTLEGLREEAKRVVLEELKHLSPNVDNFEAVKDDASKFVRDTSGMPVGTKGGTLLYIKVKKYSGIMATLEATSWFGNLGAVMFEYQGVYFNGKWRLRPTRFAIS